MRPFVIASLALTLFTAPAFADGVETGLSFTQVQHELGGYSCAGSTCSHSADGSRQQVTVSADSTHVYFGAGLSRCGRFIAEFDENCTLQSLVRTTGGGNSVTTVRTIATVDTTTKVLGFDGGSGTFTISTTTTSVDK